MMDRIYFKNSQDCFKFFDDSRSGSKLNSWKALANQLKTTRCVLDNYRLRKLCLPEDRFYYLLKLIEEDKRNYFLKAIEKRDENWGQIKGGKITYSKHKHLFEVGRKIAIQFRRENVKYNFDINMPLSEDLCEFLGVVIGDGFTNKYDGRHYQTQIVGDKNLDSHYYYNKLSP